MERELFALLLSTLDELDGVRHRPRKCQYTERDILAVLLWAVLHDRPIDWACKRKNWPTHDRTRPLPSGSTMSRRLRTESVRDLLLRWLLAINLVRDDGPLILDAKALAVAWHSTDPDAGIGRGVGQLSKGYKLHAIVDRDGNLRAFAVLPLNVSEQAAAEHLIDQLPQEHGRVLLADGNYDSNRLYDRAADKGIQLIAERRYKRAKGLGHRRHSPYRLEALRRMEAAPDLLAERRLIEGCFGTLGNVVGGLSSLPNWVRRRGRVERWVIGKLLIDAAHRRKRKLPIAA
ncbi:MAG TPA: IS4/IS5 family transposase [Phycisphaerales bacterium]|nr:IS4/IS5 family transposase [Phycisphaerales bacterium]